MKKSAIRSDVKVETATRRAILVNEGEGYGLLLDPAAVTATQIKTPQGSLTLNVKTKEVSWDLAGQRDGSVILEYMLLVGMQPVSALRVSLFLKKITGEKAFFFLPKGLQSEKYFSHAHVAAKNDFFFAACGRQALRGFLIKCVSIENLRSNCYEYDTKRQGSGAGTDPDRLPNGRRSRTLPADCPVQPSVEIPKDTANGDYTTTFCLAAAKALRKNPREVAQILLDNMDLSGSYFTSAAMAGPGFLNFTLGTRWFGETVCAVQQAGADYGKNNMLSGKKYMVEFVSANPTGPMHMGNARGGVLGDTLASVLQKSGADVWREFYVNDAGNQIEKFAKSLEARYFQIFRGEDAVEFPEDGYHGDDIRELVRLYADAHGDDLLHVDEKDPPRYPGPVRPGPQHSQDEGRPGPLRHPV